MFSYEKIWIIGGESIYKSFIDNKNIDKIYLTEIDQEFKCDTFFPEIPENFTLLEKSRKFQEYHLSYQFKIYKNTGSKPNYDVENELWMERLKHEISNPPM